MIFLLPPPVIREQGITGFAGGGHDSMNSKGDDRLGMAYPHERGFRLYGEQDGGNL